MKTFSNTFKVLLTPTTDTFPKARVLSDNKRNRIPVAGGEYRRLSGNGFLPHHIQVLSFSRQTLFVGARLMNLENHDLGKAGATYIVKSIEDDKVVLQEIHDENLKIILDKSILRDEMVMERVLLLIMSTDDTLGVEIPNESFIAELRVSINED